MCVSQKERVKTDDPSPSICRPSSLPIVEIGVEIFCSVRYLRGAECSSLAAPFRVVVGGAWCCLVVDGENQLLGTCVVDTLSPFCVHKREKGVAIYAHLFFSSLTPLCT